jgi:hypothetical protein
LHARGRHKADLIDAGMNDLLENNAQRLLFDPVAINLRPQP